MTTSDLAPFIGIIERLKPLLNSAEFSEVFRILTAEISKPKQFLIKMELKRLSQPCAYYIDLRGKVDGDVRTYEHAGKVHYLDDMAIRIFERGLKQYGGYTLGLYEEVTNAENNYRVRHKHETEQRIKSALAGANTEQTTDTAEEKRPTKLVQFASYCTRSEERMNFIIDLELQTNDETFQGSTVDISVSGCKIKIPANRKLAAGQKISLFFRGLEQEFALGFQHGVEYEVIDTEPFDRSSYARLRRCQVTEDHGFGEFLRNFINGNKRRYKVNLDNTLEAVIIKGYEQFYLPRIKSLPVFIAVREGLPTPLCALTTENNRQSLYYFQDELQQNVLSQMLVAKRIKQCLQKAPLERSTILYCFTHAAKGRIFYYSATQEELLQQPELMPVFLGFGASKASFKIFHLIVQRTHPADAHMLLSLPDTADGEVQKLNEPPSQLVQNMLQDVRYVAALTDITSDEQLEAYQQYQFEDSQLGSLKVFGHPKSEQLPPLEGVAVQYVNLRSESRFLYKTNVLLKINREKQIAGTTRDFSCRGLQIEASEPVEYTKGDKLQLALPDMQKISSKYGLTDLNYEVMAVSKNRLIMNLRIIEAEEPHQARLFFEQLIKSNRSKLTLAEEMPKYAGLGNALRNMYIKALNSFPFYMHRHGIRYELNTIGQGNELNNLHRLLSLFTDKNQQINLQAFLKSNTVNLHFANLLKNMNRQDLPQTIDFFVRYRPNQRSLEQSFVTEFDFELKTANAKQFLVQDALANDVLYCFRIFLSRTGRPDTEHISKELSYVSSYAIHRAKVLEEELWSVVGIGDVIDISDELLQRYQVPLAVQQQQRQKRAQFIQAIEQRLKPTPVA